MEPGSAWNGKYDKNVNWQMFSDISAHVEVEKCSQFKNVTFALCKHTRTLTSSR